MRIVFKKSIITLALISVGLVGCANSGGPKEDVGAVLGTLAGALIGSQVGKGQGRTLATILGAIGGGLLGKQFGRYLDEEDRKKVAEATQISAESNSAQVYVSPKSGAKVTMTPTGQSTYELGPEILVVRGVDTRVPLIADRQSLLVRGNTDILAGPITSAKPLKRLATGEPVDVLARVANSPFRLVAQNGVAIGYLEAANLITAEEVKTTKEREEKLALERKQLEAKAAQAKRTATARNTRPAAPGKPQEPSVKAVEVASAPTSPFAGPAGSAADPATASVPVAVAVVAVVSAPVSGTQSPSDFQKISVSSECRVIKRQVEVPNGPRGVEDVKLCKEPPKEWKQIAALSIAARSA